MYVSYRTATVAARVYRFNPTSEPKEKELRIGTYRELPM